MISLAEECWLNEYVNVQSEKEINQVIKLKDKIENDKEINELEITILGCYIPLNSSKIIINKLFDYKPLKVLDKGFIRVVDYMGNDNSIVQAARVSYGKGTKKKSQDEV